MTVRPITSPLAGEHVIVVDPPFAYPQVDGGWMKRLRLFQGRALDDIALTDEQDSRAGKLAMLGQTRSPGIVTGLEIALETQDGAQLLHVTPGIGLLPSGEDVVLGQELRIAIASFGTIDPAVRAAILVLSPTITRAFDRFDPEDPCERDENEDAFSDEQRVDGVQFELLPWDPAWGALDAAGARRNQLAYTIFELERQLPPGEIAPWQRHGVPLALLGLDGGSVSYLDRHAVARIGGDPPVRAPLVAESARVAGTPALWQARILQLGDHLADLRTQAGSLPSALAAQLDRLPPAGILPRDAVALSAPITNRFFPPTWRIKAVPLPLEQLDFVLNRSAALTPLSTAISEEAMVLVPVPQAVFEPHLLETDLVSPEFQQAIDNLIVERTDWLGRRIYLRSRRDALVAAIDPTSVVAYPNPDPDQLEDEGTLGEVSALEEAFDVQVDGTTLRSAALVALKGRLDANVQLTPTDRDNLYTLGLVKFIDDMEHRVQQADDAVDIGFLRAQTDIYRLRQHMLGNVLGTQLATSPALATIAKGESAAAVREDLASLFAALKHTTAVSTPTPPTTTTPSTPPPAPSSTPIGIAATTTFARPLTLIRPTATPALALTVTRTAEPELALGPAGITPAAELLTPRAALGASETPRLAIDRELARTAAGGIDGAVPDSIREGSAIIGASEFRNITAAQRIDPPPANEGRNFAVASRHEALLAIDKLDALKLKVDDIPIYSLPGGTNGSRIPSSTFGDLKGGAGIGSVLVDPPPTNGAGEDVFFHDTVTLVEAHIGTLRGIEGRIAQYRAVIRDCKAVLEAVRASLARLDTRMEVVQHEITDTRHAVATARSLLAEEEVRVERINQRRSAVLAQYVELLAYVRPRFFDGIVEVPELALDPALLEAPVPACIAGHNDAPPEIDEMIALLREAPLSWFRLGPPILRHLDRVELLHGAILTARTRALAIADTGFQSRFATEQLTGRFAKSLSAVGRAQVDAVWQPRAKVAELDVRQFVGLSWQESRNAAQHILSIGDLIEGMHRKADAIREAHALISNIEKVAGCLWARVGEVLPAIRLAWAEALDEYDHAHMTINLPVLPDWREVPYTLRKSIELLADWLIQQIDRTIPDAVSWMHDLVRACILLASHAPIDQIIAGSVPSASPASPGHLVPIIIDPIRTKIGMRVTFFRGQDVVAHGVVEDLVGERARARIAEAVVPELRLEAGTRARFAAAASPPIQLLRGVR